MFEIVLLLSTINWYANMPNGIVAQKKTEKSHGDIAVPFNTHKRACVDPESFVRGA